MNKTVGTLMVFFDGQFWVGVFEKVTDGKLSVCKVTFGAEPKDSEVYDFILKNYYNLKFSPEVESTAKTTARNPKRQQREARKQVHSFVIGTKSQQALKLQQELMKTDRKNTKKERREADKQRHFELKQKKRKEKHKGH